MWFILSLEKLNIYKLSSIWIIININRYENRNLSFKIRIYKVYSDVKKYYLLIIYLKLLFTSEYRLIINIQITTIHKYNKYHIIE